jgi:predicted NAD-dependent protein-ADP-ribosyltransferase YbiA (DUF1768 family)
MAQDYVYFKSSEEAPYYMLSNFFHAPFVLKRRDVTLEMCEVCPGLADWVPEEGVRFPTSEHAWQSLKAADKATFLRFTCDGDLGKWDPNVFAKSVAHRKDPLAAATLALKKLKHWSAKNNLGIQAKLAANPDYAKRLGLDNGRMAFDRERLAPEIERAVWLTILRLKFRQNEGPRETLLSTRGKRLVEREIGAVRLLNAGKPVPHWGGLVAEDGTVVGDNAMGKYVQATRDSLF